MLYGLLLLSSVVTGTAAMVPIFVMMFQLGLIDSRFGVALVMTGGLLPAAIFILKDFVDAVPKSYEESENEPVPGTTVVLTAPVSRVLLYDRESGDLLARQPDPVGAR